MFDFCGMVFIINDDQNFVIDYRPTKSFIIIVRIDDVTNKSKRLTPFFVLYLIIQQWKCG